MTYYEVQYLQPSPVVELHQKTIFIVTKNIFSLLASAFHYNSAHEYKGSLDYLKYNLP